MKSLSVKTTTSLVTIILAVISTMAHLLVINNLEYHRDELLYFSLGLHPAAGYETVPPLIGWIAFLMQSIFGYSVFAVRLFPALLSGVIIIIVSNMARELGGSVYASFLAGFGLLISNFFLRTYSLFMPVFIELFLWTLCIYLVIKYINTLNENYLLFLGVTAGFALLNKYLAGLLFIGLFVIIPFTVYREVLMKKKFWAGMAAGFVIFLPNLVWQVAKGFPVFHHITQLYDTQLVHMNMPLFLIEQLIMPVAGTFFTLAGLIYIFTGKKVKKFRFLGFLALFVIVALMFLKGKSYYTLGVFPFLIAAGAAAYENWFRKTWIRIVFPLIIILITLPVIPIGIPVFKQEGLVNYFRVVKEKFGNSMALRFEDGSVHTLPQDYADMLGWEELTAIVDNTYQAVDDKQACFIYCENYGQAGAITIIGKKYGLPGAISFNESFKYWIPEKFNPDIKTLIYINDEPGEDVRALFKKITKTGSITNINAREYGTAVYLCEDPAESFNKFWTLRIKSLL
jgi:hypothetical protein